MIQNFESPAPNFEDQAHPYTEASPSPADEELRDIVSGIADSLAVLSKGVQQEQFVARGLRSEADCALGRSIFLLRPRRSFSKEPINLKCDFSIVIHIFQEFCSSRGADCSRMEADQQRGFCS